MTHTNILPATIEMRAIKFISKGFQVIEAVKMAIEEEHNMICSLITDAGFPSEKGKKVTEIMSSRIWRKHNNLNPKNI